MSSWIGIPSRPSLYEPSSISRIKIKKTDRHTDLDLWSHARNCFPTQSRNNEDAIIKVFASQHTSKHLKYLICQPLRQADRQTDKQTYRQTDRDVTHHPSDLCWSKTTRTTNKHCGASGLFYSISEEAIKTELNSRREKNATFLAHLKILDKKDAQWSRNKKGHC